MPYSRSRWYCNKCHKGHGSFKDAQGCETGHIVSQCTEDFQKDLSEIMDRKFGKSLSKGNENDQ